MNFLDLFPNLRLLGLPARCNARRFPFHLTSRKGRQHTGEFRQFLYIAIGSAAELDTQLIVAVELGYIGAEQAQPLFALILEIRKMTYALINKLPR
jgi:hypothetical protein